MASLAKTITTRASTKRIERTLDPEEEGDRAGDHNRDGFFLQSQFDGMTLNLGKRGWSTFEGDCAISIQSWN